MRLVRTLGAAAAVVALTALALPTPAAAAAAAPALTITKTTNLADGEQVMVSGAGFSPNLQGMPVGQCKEGYTGPTDCNLQGGAQFVNTDAEGKFAAVALVLKAKFGSTDCTAVKCVIGAAPLPTGTSMDVVLANMVVVPLTFAAGGAAPTTAAPTTAAPAPTTATTSAAAAAPAESDNNLPLYIGIAVAVLLVAGIGIAMARRKKAPAA